MDDKGELKKELEQKLLWIHYRQNMLNIIEEKLSEMRRIAEKAKDGSLSMSELEALNAKLINLAEQVRALDSESKRIEDESILE